LFEAIKLQVEGLVMGGNAGVTNDHRSSLEDGQLPALLLFLSLEVQSQDCLIHHPGQEKDLLDLLCLGDSAQLITQGNGDLGLKKPFLLFGFGWDSLRGIVILTLNLSKLIVCVKYCDIDIVMGFVTKGYA
jgi:hypothetical protein